MSGRNVAATDTSGLARFASEPALAEDTLATAAKLAVRVAGALTLAVMIVALVTRLAFAIEARQWLAYPFPGVPAKAGIAAAIFTHNLRALLTVGGALLILQIQHWARTAPEAIYRWMRLAVGALLGAAVLANVVLVGVSFGAYGARMVSAALPHGPVELASYSLALALYLQGRSRRLAPRHVLKVGALSVALLAIAAALETFLSV